ncbi:MAG: SsrA-binding protein SmpB [Rhodothermales bacterium]|nr:SsrA-binding protein SmpB [Rhodothermales bacterium]
MASEPTKTIINNRKARYEYELLDRYEAGIELKGSEVKSLRDGKVNLQEAFCDVKGDRVVLLNCHIAPYTHGGYTNHEPTRPRTLLLHKKEIRKLAKAVEQKGLTIVPTRMYFKRGWAKLEIAVARGKKLHDKRRDIAERDTKRRLDRLTK